MRIWGISVQERGELKYSNESPGNFTFYRGIHEFSNPSIFEKITVFCILCCNCHFTENSVKWQIQHKNRYFFKTNYDNCNVLLQRILKPCIFEKNNGFYAVVTISQDFL